MENDHGDHPSVQLHPPSMLIGAMVIGYVFRLFLGGWLPMPRWAGEGIGGALLISAVIILVSGISAFAQSGETLKPATPSSELFTTGPFAYSRNPIYLAMLLFGVGFGFATLNFWAILMAVLLGLLLNFLVIVPEEDYLARRFGAEYDAYRKTTRRWL